MYKSRIFEIDTYHHMYYIYEYICMLNVQVRVHILWLMVLLNIVRLIILILVNL